jgi:hypothetical protein
MAATPRREEHGCRRHPITSTPSPPPHPPPRPTHTHTKASPHRLGDACCARCLPAALAFGQPDEAGVEHAERLVLHTKALQPLHRERLLLLQLLQAGCGRQLEGLQLRQGVVADGGLEQVRQGCCCIVQADASRNEEAAAV